MGTFSPKSRLGRSILASILALVLVVNPLAGSISWLDGIAEAASPSNRDGLGLEPYWNTVPFDLGNGWGLSVNTFSGNVTLTKTLFVIGGKGPGLTEGLAYNSLAGRPNGPDLVVDGTTAGNSTDGIKHDASNPLVLDGVQEYRTVAIQNGAVVTVSVYNGNTGGEAIIHASDSISVDASSTITVTAKGYRGGAGGVGTGAFGTGWYAGQAGEGPGGGHSSHAGGGYGSAGWTGENKGTDSTGRTADGAAGPTYGDPSLATVYLGSGGGGGLADWPSGSRGGAGGAGGGSIQLAATHIDIAGTLEAGGGNGLNGATRYDRGGGGGSGGSIKIQGRDVSLTGKLSVRGGSGGLHGTSVGGRGATGGLGRIRVEYENTFSGSAEVNYSSNLALARPVTITVGSANTSFPVARITDGNTSYSQYAEVRPDTAGYGEVAIDLGTAMPLSQVTVWHYYGDTRSYHDVLTRVSPDGVTWTTLYDSTQSGEYVESSTGKALAVPAGDYRYIRDRVHGNTVNTGNHWVEIQAAGQDPSTYSVAQVPYSPIAPPRPTSQGWKVQSSLTILTQPNGDALFVDGDGTNHTFTVQTDGSYLAPPGVLLELSKVGAGYILRDRAHSEYTFEDGRLTRILDRNGNSTIYLYDTAGVLTSAQDSSGRTLAYSYGLDGNLESVMDPAGRVYTFHYNANGQIDEVTDPSGAPTTFGYDSDLQLNLITDAVGHLTRLEYGIDGRLARIVDARSTADYAYVTSFLYDTTAFTTAVTNPLGYSWSYEHNAAGNAVRVTDPNGSVITASWDGNQITQVQDPKGATTLGYDPRGNANLSSRTISDTSSVTSHYSYDEGDNLVQVQSPSATTYDLRRDDRGNELGLMTTTRLESDSANYDQSGNLTGYSGTEASPENLLKNSSFEQVTDGVIDWWMAGGAAADVTVDGTTSLFGNSSVRVESATPDTSYIFSPSLQTFAGDKLTLSAYALLEQLQGDGAAIGMEFFDAQGGLLGQEYSNLYSGSGDSRLVVTATAPQGVDHAIVVLRKDNSSGTVWFDGVQLERPYLPEEGHILSSYDAVENGGFEDGAWTATGAATGHGELYGPTKVFADSRIAGAENGGSLAATTDGRVIMVYNRGADVMASWADSSAALLNDNPGNNESLLVSGAGGSTLANAAVFRYNDGKLYMLVLYSGTESGTPGWLRLYRSASGNGDDFTFDREIASWTPNQYSANLSSAFVGQPTIIPEGPHAGRLVVPAGLMMYSSGNWLPQPVVFYTDDLQTWSQTSWYTSNSFDGASRTLGFYKGYLYFSYSRSSDNEYVYRSTDGANWEYLYGVGPALSNSWYRTSFQAFGDYLYRASATTAAGNGRSVWRTKNPASPNGWALCVKMKETPDPPRN